MKQLSHIAQRDLSLFFLFTFIWSWLFWLPKILGTAGILTLSGPLNFILGTIAVFGPSVAAFSLTYARQGLTGVRQLWQRGWTWHFSKIWFLPTFILMPATSLLAVILLSLLNYDIQWKYGLPPIMIFPIFILIFFTNALPEEYGWRGFALDQLQQRWNALSSSLIMGALWGIWHLPLFFISGSAQYEASIPIWQFIIQTIVLSVFYTWLHNNTGRSVSVAMLFHTVGNIISAAIPIYATAEGRWMSFVIQLLAAMIIIVVWKPKHLAFVKQDG